MGAWDDMRRSLCRPEAFPVATRSVQVAETHISLVFLTDSRVYKIKKPVTFPFLDYGTLEKRHWACEEEIRLNRRLAPNVYLGVVAITRDADSFRVGGDGPAIEYCVEMTRLPDGQFLDQWIAQGKAGDRDIERLLDVLVPFYRGATIHDDRVSHAQVETIAKEVDENISTIEPLLDAKEFRFWRRVRSSQRQFLALHAEIFDQRIAEGAIVEGHGDLRPEHVCFLDPPVVFDAVEFSLAFRVADVASELAFLAMEMDFLGSPRLSRTLLEGFRRRTGDALPTRLVAFYQAYRATVRGKVALLRAGQEAGDKRDEDHRRAGRYLHLAAAYASEFHQPVAIVVFGAAGVGKSTIARGLAARLGVEVFRSDAIRQVLAGGRDLNAGKGEGIYDPSMTAKTYEEMFRRGDEDLRHGVSVAFDATFVDRPQREAVRTLARDLGVPILFVYCECPPKVAESRIAARRAEGRDVSDARPETHHWQLEQFRGADDLTAADVLRVDTTRPAGETIDRIVHAVARLSLL